MCQRRKDFSKELLAWSSLIQMYIFITFIYVFMVVEIHSHALGSMGDGK